jgi:hypothetical protein
MRGVKHQYRDMKMTPEQNVKVANEMALKF